jgi:hypothetical protein
MANHAHTTAGGYPPPPDLIDLNAHPDGALLRVCAALERLRAITDEMEQIAASIPAQTPFGRKMKAMAL